MKKANSRTRTRLTALAILAAVFLIAGCAENKKGLSQVDGENSNAVGNLYSCPMHPEVQSSGPGNCPKCGMALELRGASTGTSTRTERKPKPPYSGSGSSHGAHH